MVLDEVLCSRSSGLEAGRGPHKIFDKKKFIYIAYYMYVSKKNRKRHYILGFHYSIRPPPAPLPLPVAGPKFAQQSAAQPRPRPSGQPPDSAPPPASCNDDGCTSTAPAPPTLAAGAAPAVRRLAERRRETCRPAPHLSRAGEGDGTAAGLQRRHQAEPRRGAPQRVSAQRRRRRRRGAQDQPRAASTTTSPPSSRLPVPFFLSSSSI
jgi:hypothetical protein